MRKADFITTQLANEEVDRLRASCDAWKETAEQHCRNETFYRNLLVDVGELFGDAAKTQDDGGICEDVLALKVKECVMSLKSERDALKADAERYRWLREFDSVYPAPGYQESIKSDDEIDAAIDASRRG
jgi:hypothetical protein